MKTATMAPFLNLEAGLAEFPGQLAAAPSVAGPPPDVPLVTARFLPAEFFAEEALVAEQAAQLDEGWDSDQLLERICNLEQTLLWAENSMGPATSAGPLDPAQPGRWEAPAVAAHAPNPAGSVPHLSNPPNPAQANPAQATSRAGNSDATNSRATNSRATNAAQPISNAGTSNAGNSGAGNSGAGNSGAGNAGGEDGPTAQRSRSTGPRKPSQSSLPLVRIDRGHVIASPQREPRTEDPRTHRIDLPIAVPLGSLELRPDAPTEAASAARSTEGPATWGAESQWITCLGLGTAWLVQMMIGWAGLVAGPLSTWSLWLIAQTLGTICLGRLFWQVLAPDPADADRREARGVPIPTRHAGGGRDAARPSIRGH
jgi:hypothetical protein